MSCAGVTALALSILLAVVQEGIKGTAAILVYTLSSIWRTFLCFVFRTATQQPIVSGKSKPEFVGL